MTPAEQTLALLEERRVELLNQLRGPARSEAPGRRRDLFDSLVELETALATMRAASALEVAASALEAIDSKLAAIAENTYSAADALLRSTETPT